MLAVFGSINVDIELRMDRLPAPGETVLGDHYTLSPGGKGANQAVAAARAGARVRLFGCVGADRFAEAALSLMGEAGVDADGVTRVDDAPTGVASVWVDASGENSIVVAPGANNAARAELIPPGVLGPDTLVLLQMETPDTENWRVVERAKAAGAKVLLNLAPARFAPPDVLRRIDYLMVNEGEACVLARELGLDSPSPLALPRLLSDGYGPIVVMTRGGAGLVCAARTGGWTVPALPVAPVDTTAAGDATIGAFAAALDEGWDLLLALKWGCVAGGLACTRAGSQAALPTRAEIQAELDSLPRERAFG